MRTTPREPLEKCNFEGGIFLKLHGSIDWFYCLNKGCRAYQKVFPMTDPSKDYFCSECYSSLQRLIVPPTLNKQFDKYSTVQVIWHSAGNEIKVANELIVWGYSLPPTDFYASWLLRQARVAPLKKLTIINPEVTKDGFVSRFYEFFRDLIPDSEVYRFEGFDQYYQNV